MNELIITQDGTTIFQLNGVPHRNELPAMQYADGTLKYYVSGSLHNMNGPAVWRYGEDVTWAYNGKILHVGSDITIAEFRNLIDRFCKNE